MRVSLSLIGVLLASCAPARSAPASAEHGDGAPPSYVAEVRPILESRCLECHSNGGEAGEEHDFTKLETVRAQRQRIAEEAAERAMPPSPKPPLTQAEADTLVRWAACGTR